MKLFIIDGHAQAHRYNHTRMDDLRSPEGIPTKIVYLFTKMIFKIIEKYKPDYFACAFDSSRFELWRKKIDPLYKDNRPSGDSPDFQEFITQLQIIREVLELLDVPILEVKTQEADDVIASVVTLAAERRIKSFIVSRDKDFVQLVRRDLVYIFDPVEDLIKDYDYLVDKLGYSPEVAAVVQALTGDVVDNVPGVPKIGVKTAAKLAEKYGSVEEVIANCDLCTPAICSSIEQNADRIRLNEKLVTLYPGVFSDDIIDIIKFNRLNTEQAKPLFERLGFKRWAV